MLASTYRIQHNGMGGSDACRDFRTVQLSGAHVCCRPLPPVGHPSRLLATYCCLRFIPLQALFAGSLISAISVYFLIILFGVFDEKATVQP